MQFRLHELGLRVSHLTGGAEGVWAQFSAEIVVQGCWYAGQ